MIPAGYQGAAQHTFTFRCDGFHDPGPCPEQPRTVVIDLPEGWSWWQR